MTKNNFSGVCYTNLISETVKHLHTWDTQGKPTRNAYQRRSITPSQHTSNQWKTIFRMNQAGRPNLTKGEFKAMADLSNREHIIITKADKGEAVVILDVKDVCFLQTQIALFPNYATMQP